MPLNVIPKKDWGAIPSGKKVNPVNLPVPSVFYCYTQSSPCADIIDCKFRVREIQIRNIKKYKYPDIRYNFMIDHDCNVYIGRGWKKVPSLPHKYQQIFGDFSILIAFIGTFNQDIKVPQNMVDTRDEVIRYGIKKGFVRENYVLMFS